MAQIGRFSIAAIATLGALAAMPTLASATPLHHVHHVLHHVHGGRYMSTGSIGIVAPDNRGLAMRPAEAAYETRPAWAMRDDDSGNSKNPSLPSYAQNKGGETGGPGRMYIPN